MCSISVKAPAGFAAKPAGINHADEEGTGSVFGVADALFEDAHDVETDVEADEVGEGEWAHGVGHAELEDFIYSLGCRYAFHDGEDGLVDERHENTVGDEACGVVNLYGCLAELLREDVDGVEGCL